MAKSTITGTGIAWLAVALVVALGAVTWYVQGQQNDRTTALAKEVLALKKAGDGETAEKQLKSVAAQLKTISGSVSAMSSRPFNKQCRRKSSTSSSSTSPWSSVMVRPSRSTVNL